mgnify:CR=1 FL=1
MHDAGPIDESNRALYGEACESLQELGEVGGDTFLRFLQELNDEEYDEAAAYAYAKIGTIEDFPLPSPEFELLPLHPHNQLDVYRAYSGVSDAEAKRVGELAHHLLLHDPSRVLSCDRHA